ncbi:hypothetical protein BaRGS_00000766, partial [Batillaria attramentaria]
MADMGFTLAWVVVAVVGWVVLQLGSVVCSGENKLKLEVVRHCVPDSAQLSRTHVFHRGCTIELLCYYKPCSKEIPSDLVVSRMYDGEITNMEERTRTNCTLMVKLRNMTDSSAGVYTCRDNYNRLNSAKPLEFKAPHLQVKVKELCLHHQHTLNEKPTVLYYYVGCSIRLMCRYVPCLDTTHTNLTITTMRGENQTRRPVEWSRSKCSVEVEFGNMTAAFAGAYRCQDTCLPKRAEAESGYSFDLTVTRIVTLQILSATEEFAGTYACHELGSDQQNFVSCNLELRSLLTGRRRCKHRADEADQPVQRIELMRPDQNERDGEHDGRRFSQ